VALIPPPKKRLTFEQWLQVAVAGGTITLAGVTAWLGYETHELAATTVEMARDSANANLPDINVKISHSATAPIADLENRGNTPARNLRVYCASFPQHVFVPTAPPVETAPAYPAAGDSPIPLLSRGVSIHADIATCPTFIGAPPKGGGYQFIYIYVDYFDGPTSDTHEEVRDFAFSWDDRGKRFDTIAPNGFFASYRSYYQQRAKTARQHDDSK
jgi:hypothetical protein